MKTWLITGWLLVWLPLAAVAQEIPIKTLPVATGDQFLLFPSQNLGMGGVSFALDDPLLDPFVNPARGINTQGFRFTSTPIYYGISIDENWRNEASSGRTLPVGMLMRRDRLFGGAMLAWQELSQETEDFCCFFGGDLAAIQPERRSLSENNLYAFGLGGAQLAGTNLSVGVSAFVADLDGLEGVRLLYWDGNRVTQSGGMSAFRVGLYQQWDDGRSADLVVLHHRFHMDHQMPRWDFERQRWGIHTEKDETLGWAVQAGYQYPLGRDWRLGGQLTGDWKHHPKIPNYDVMQIPRDPGNSSAYRLGVGLARTTGAATFGLDLAYEPIWSHTWADALVDTPITGSPNPDDVIPAGNMTVENFFRFDNTLVRMGVRRAGDVVDFGLGLNVHTYRYDLDQEDFVARTVRTQRESWSEWVASFSLGLHFPEFQVRYLGLLTLGTGRPGIQVGWAQDAAFQAGAASSDFVVAPGGPLTLQDARVFTHQITLLIPITE